jgi:hypothetical protein
MKLGVIEINPSSACDREYAAGLSEVETLEKLRSHIDKWLPLVADAERIVMAMSDSDFQEFKQGLALERRGRFAGVEYAEKYSAIIMPEILFHVTMLGQSYHAPWGLMFLRMAESGLIEIEVDGRAYLKGRS